MGCINGRLIKSTARQRIEEISLNADAKMIPLFAMIELTYRCNIDCVMCYCQHLTNTAGQKELTLDEWKRTLDELAQLGCLYLTISGGEILIRKDFFEIARHAKSLHFAIGLFTNGTMIDEKRADLLAELRPYEIEMSLMGATEEKHDRLTKTPGSYRRMMRAAGLLKERDLPFAFKTTLLNENAREQPEMERIAKLQGCREYRNGTEVTPRNDGNRDVLQYQMTRQQLFDYFAAPPSIQPEIPAEAPIVEAIHKPSCGSGSTGCFINPFGDFMPCIQLTISFGNIRERSLEEMWHNPPETIAAIRRIKEYGQIPVCAKCNVVNYCKRCHGLAHLETGHWDSCYAQARTQAEIVRDLFILKNEGIAPEYLNTHSQDPEPNCSLVRIGINEIY